MDTVAAAEMGVRDAIRAGAQEADAYVTVGHILSIEVERAAPKAVRSNREGGIGIRAYIGGCMGFSYANQLKSLAIHRAARSAVAQCRAGTPDPEFLGLPGDGGVAEVPGLYDAALPEVAPKEVMSGLQKACERAHAMDRRVYSIGATFSLGWAEVALANAHGLQRTSKETAYQASTEVVCREGTSAASSFTWSGGRSLAGADMGSLVETAAAWSLRGLKTSSLGTTTVPAVLDPMAVAALLSTGLGVGVSAEEVQRKRSYLSDKLGEPVGVKGLNVVDDATLAGAVGSHPFDGEGVAGRRTKVVDSGILRSFLHDSYTAGKEGVASTGNALRSAGPTGLPNFRAPPNIGPTTLVVKPGLASLEDLVGGVDLGLYVRATGDRPNLATGEFSGLASEGFLIRDGEIQGAVRETTFAFSMLDLLRNVESISRDKMALGDVIAPALWVRAVRVAGPG